MAKSATGHNPGQTGSVYHSEGDLKFCQSLVSSLNITPKT